MRCGSIMKTILLHVNTFALAGYHHRPFQGGRTGGRQGTDRAFAAVNTPEAATHLSKADCKRNLVLQRWGCHPDHRRYTQ